MKQKEGEKMLRWQRKTFTSKLAKRVASNTVEEIFTENSTLRPPDIDVDYSYLKNPWLKITTYGRPIYVSLSHVVSINLNSTKILVNGGIKYDYIDIEVVSQHTMLQKILKGDNSDVKS